MENVFVVFRKSAKGLFVNLPQQHEAQLTQ
jgi:hypothetical protein